MTDRTPIECEARLVGLSKQRRKDGDWTEVRFHIHPDDTPHALFILPLGTDCNLAISGIDATAPAEPQDAQTPSEALRVANDPERPPGGPLARRAGILCKQAGFQDTMFAMGRARNLVWSAEFTREDAAAAILRRLCGLNKSRAELDHNAQAASIFEQIERDYHDAREGRTPEALAEQARHCRG